MKFNINQDFLRQLLLLLAVGLTGLLMGMIIAAPRGGGVLQSPEGTMMIDRLDPAELRAFINQTYRLDEEQLRDGVVASRNGEVYYYSTCSGWGRIKEENRIWFLSHEEAEQEGYRLAKSCQ